MLATDVLWPFLLDSRVSGEWGGYGLTRLRMLT
jgi:hypothetical protein